MQTVLNVKEIQRDYIVEVISSMSDTNVILILCKQQLADQKPAFRIADPFLLQYQFNLPALFSHNHDLAFICISDNQVPSCSGFVNLLHTLASNPGYEGSLG